MGTFMVWSVCLVVLVPVTRFLIVRKRVGELGRDFSLELACPRRRAVAVAALAARGVMWQVEFTDNGLYTRHIFAGNVVHVAISGHPGRPGRCAAEVRTRCRLADDRVFVAWPKSVLDTRRKRDRILRALSVHAASATTRGGRRVNPRS